MINENQFVIPAQAGIQVSFSSDWIPAFAGMTEQILSILNFLC